VSRGARYPLHRYPHALTGPDLHACPDLHPDAHPHPIRRPPGGRCLLHQRRAGGAADARIGYPERGVGPDLRISLLSRESLPAGLAEWTQEGEAVLWIALYDPLPEAPLANVDWLFVLDVDGDPTTGRPPGTRPINVGLGDEAAVGLFYTLETETYAPFFSVWDPAQEGFVSVPAQVRFWLSDDRRVIGLAMPLATLREQVERVAGVTLRPEAVRGRAAAIAFLAAEPVADLYPDPLR